MKDCDQYKALLMGLMDGELTPDELQEINSHLIRCSSCREEYEGLRNTAVKIDAVSFIEPQDEVLKRLWRSPYGKSSKISGLLLVLAGWLLLVVYGFFEMLRDPNEPPLPRIGIAAVIVGFVVLLVSVIYERIRTYKSDPYKEVER